jgi:hypothetical protein
MSPAACIEIFSGQWMASFAKLLGLIEHPAFVSAIAHVVFLCANAQMLRVAAGRIVASMYDESRIDQIEAKIKVSRYAVCAA